MTNTISTRDAAQFALAYHDAMTISRTGDDFHLCGRDTNARSAVERYLQLSEKAGVTLHNESWVTYIRSTVEDIEKRKSSLNRVTD